MSVADYKYKPDKHIFIQNTRTIDETHREYIDKFKKENENLIVKKTQLDHMKDKLNEQKKHFASERTVGFQHRVVS